MQYYSFYYDENGIHYFIRRELYDKALETLKAMPALKNAKFMFGNTKGEFKPFLNAIIEPSIDLGVSLNDFYAHYQPEGSDEIKSARFLFTGSAKKPFRDINIDSELQTLEKEMEMFEKSQVDTQHIEPKLRKYLTLVSAPEDVFVDKDNLTYGTIQRVVSGLESKKIPYQYDNEGNLMLNAEGKVLTSTVAKQLGIPYDGRLRYVTLFDTVLVKLISENSGEYSFDITQTLLNVCNTGLHANIYPISSTANSVNNTLVKDQLVNALEESLQGKPLKDLSILLLVLYCIMQDNLFEYNTKGIPVLTSKVSRLTYLETVV